LVAFPPYYNHLLEGEIMMKKLGLIAILALVLSTSCVRTGAAQNVTLNVGAVYSSPYYTGLSALGPVAIARFLGAPYVRKVNSTADLAVGNMTYGNPPQVSGHASIVFQYYPADNHINIPPGTSHITTTWGNQTCRVYENGTCDCGANPIWQICTGVLPGYPQTLANLAGINRSQAIYALTANGVRVTQDAVAAAALGRIVPGIARAKAFGAGPAPASVRLPGPSERSIGTMPAVKPRRSLRACSVICLLASAISLARHSSMTTSWGRPDISEFGQTPMASDSGQRVEEINSRFSRSRMSPLPDPASSRLSMPRAEKPSMRFMPPSSMPAASTAVSPGSDLTTARPTTPLL
jgi:hypothetical protein